jgi:hypothetical protein
VTCFPLQTFTSRAAGPATSVVRGRKCMLLGKSRCGRSPTPGTTYRRANLPAFIRPTVISTKQRQSPLIRFLIFFSGRSCTFLDHFHGAVISWPRWCRVDSGRREG